MSKAAPRFARASLAGQAALLAGLALLSGGCRDYTDMSLAEEVLGRDEPVQAEGLHGEAFATDGPRIRFQPAQLPVIRVAPGQEREIGSVLNVPQAMRYGEYVWDEKGKDGSISMNAGGGSQLVK